MIQSILELFKKYRQAISYLFFGALTTLVNWLVYFPLTQWLHFSAAFSTIVAWILAVLFAFLTNKPFVFQSHDWSWKVTFPELMKFVGCRVGSGFAEFLLMLITVDILMWNNLIMKILVSVLVVILNYVGSKLLVFRKN